MHHRVTEATENSVNELTEKIIGAAIAVHRELGPGLLESAYEECLAYEPTLKGVTFKRQQALPITYKAVRLDCGYRLDLLVGHRVIVEVKAVERIIHPSGPTSQLSEALANQVGPASELQCSRSEAGHPSAGELGASVDSVSPW